MQNEHFHHLWTSGRQQFTTDVHQMLAGWKHKLSGAFRVRQVIKSTCETALARKARMTAYAVFSGVLAGLMAGALAIANGAPAQTTAPAERAATVPVPLFLGIGR